MLQMLFSILTVITLGNSSELYWGNELFTKFNLILQHSSSQLKIAIPDHKGRSNLLGRRKLIKKMGSLKGNAWEKLIEQGSNKEEQHIRGNKLKIKP